MNDYDTEKELSCSSGKKHRMSDREISQEIVCRLLGYKDWDDATDYRLTGTQNRQRDQIIKVLSDYDITKKATFPKGPRIPAEPLTFGRCGATIIIEPVQKYGMRGDRDIGGRHPYFDYKIHVIDQGKGSLVHTIDGYDHWWTTPLNHESVRNKATHFARRLAKSINGCVVWKKPKRNK